MGIMMGLFNMFIVIPQIFAALGGVNFLSSLLGAAPIYAMVLAGVSLLLSAFSNLLITN
jgi:maltose/moltooligosaccharide transporter